MRNQSFLRRPSTCFCSCVVFISLSRSLESPEGYPVMTKYTTFSAAGLDDDRDSEVLRM